MLRRESYLTFPDQKDANTRFYTQVGMLKYLITKPMENQVNIVTTLVTRIKAWKSQNQWKVLFLCLVLYSQSLTVESSIQSVNKLYNHSVPVSSPTVESGIQSTKVLFRQ